MELLKAWRDWEFGSAPYLLSGDDALKKGPKQHVATHASWEDFIGEASFGSRGDTRLHLGLVPVPFAGDVEKATVIVLLLNPGLEPDDYFGEYKVPGFRDKLICNLRQDFSRTAYPFVYLDPAIAWHSGYRWWHGKFQSVMASLAKEWKVNYSDARRYFSQILACVELVPYHSVSYGLPDRIREELTSAKIALEYVRNFLRPRADAGELLIVVTRQTSTWGLIEAAHVVTYEGPETRAAHLNPGSRGGKRVLEFVLRLFPQPPKPSPRSPVRCAINVVDAE
jgi:hypothetical protein